MLNPLVVEAIKKMFKGFYYTVQEGDNLEIISKRYGVNVNFIINTNKLTYPYTLKDGDKIFIPGTDEPISPQRGSVYTVYFGDTLESIAKKYNASIEEIVKVNFIPNGIIFVGQKLLIPSEESDETKSGNSESMGETQQSEEPIRIYPTDSKDNQSEAVKIISKKFGILKKGSKGKEVQTLQRLLSVLGYNIKKFDDTFGTELERQIISLQKDAGLETTGIVDERIWEYIFAKINKAPMILK